MTGLGLVALLASLPAQAQRLWNAESGNRSGVNLTINGNVASSIQLTIAGSADTPLTSTTSALNAPATGRVDFGAFSTLRRGAFLGPWYRIDSGANHGAIVAARLIATLVYQGSTTGAILLGRLQPAGSTSADISLNHLRVASPALPTWTSPSDGVQVPNAGSPGVNLCSGNCTSGKTYEHQIAIFIPDSRPAGPFSTVVVYTAVVP